MNQWEEGGKRLMSKKIVPLLWKEMCCVYKHARRLKVLFMLCLHIRGKYTVHLHWVTD